MKNNRMVVALSLVAVLGLTACGSSDSGSSADDDLDFVSESEETTNSGLDNSGDALQFADPVGNVESASSETALDNPQINWNDLMSEMAQSSSSSGVDPSSVIKGSFKDTRDDQTYRTVTIGSQTWMAENLNYNMAGSKVVTTADGYAKYGRFYNWNAAMNACPPGWHLPDYDEYMTLFGNVSSACVGGSGQVLKSTSDEWYGAGTGGNCVGTDAYGFAALPADYDNEGDDYHAKVASFWSYSTIYDWTRVYAARIYWNECTTEMALWSEDATFSVRCVKD